MKLKYLGTGASEGFPGIFCQCDPCKQARRLRGKNLRRRSSAFINDCLLIDIPPDLYGESLGYAIDLSVVKHIVVTHVHEDHFYLHELSNYAEPFAYIFDGIPARLYGSATVKEAFEHKFANFLDGHVKMVEVAPFQLFEAAGCTITPLPASHGAGISFIYIIESSGKRLLYGNDTGWLSDEVWEYIKGKRFDIVSMDCTCIIGVSYSSHMNMAQNIKLKNEFMKIGCADENTLFLATHFSHNGELMQHEMEERFAPYGILTAYDGFEVEV